MTDTDIDVGARMLSIEPAEVASAEESPAGLVVTTTDGARYVVVDEDYPDAEGKHGVMFLVAPTERYAGTFPVYAQPGAQEPVEAGPADGTIAEVLERVGDDPELAVTAIEAEQASDKPRSSLLAKLAAIATPDPAANDPGPGTTPADPAGV